MKKILALVLALAMVLMAVAAFAADGDFISTPESTIQIQNIGANDSASYFKLVQWNTTSGTWELTTLGSSCGVTLDNLVDGIDATEAATIARNLASATATGSFPASGTTRTATVTAGLYYVLATPGTGNTDTVYNPAFVSADYYEGGNSVDFSTAIANSTVLKKSTITFDKTVTGADQYVDTKPGDTIPYQIATKIPSFGAEFTNPQFTVTDTLSAGLTLKGEVSVTYGSTTVTATNDDVTITKGTPANGFTVDFSETYLKGLNGATPDVTITYSAEVTTEALNNVTYLDNKAHLTFTHTPGETTNKDDITRHYTFSIDANLLGSSNTKTHELIKTGVEADGTTPIYEETVTYHETPVAPLAGAVYTLKQGTNTIGSFTTLDDGHITFKGLDAGTYTLEETSAPAGFIRDTTVYTVTITPTYTGDNNDILSSYTITVTDGSNHSFSSGFTMNNAGEPTMTSEPETNSDFFKNTRGSALPSTGGIGTTIFYILGGLLVIGAAVVLVARRKAHD